MPTVKRGLKAKICGNFFHPWFQGIHYGFFACFSFKRVSKSVYHITIFVSNNSIIKEIFKVDVRKRNRNGGRKY